MAVLGSGNVVDFTNVHGGSYSVIGLHTISCRNGTVVCSPSPNTGVTGRRTLALALLTTPRGPLFGLFGNGVDAAADCTGDACNGGRGGLIWGNGGTGANGGFGGAAGLFGVGGVGAAATATTAARCARRSARTRSASRRAAGDWSFFTRIAYRAHAASLLSRRRVDGVLAGNH